MKRELLGIITFVSLSVAVKAQITIAPEAGLNMAIMNMKVTDLAGGSFKYNSSSKAGLDIGAVVDIPVVKGLSIQPGLFYEMAGTKFNEGDANPSGKWALNALNLPVNIEYKTGNPGGNSFFIGAGPYIAYNLSGKYTYNADPTINSYDATGNLKIGSSKEDELKPLDFGLRVNTGYMIAMGIYLRAYYQMGFTNLCPFADAHDSYKTFNYGINIGYVFKARENKGNSRAK